MKKNIREEKNEYLCNQLIGLSEDDIENSIIKEFEEREKHLEDYEKKIIDQILAMLELVKKDYRYSYRVDYHYDKNYAHMVEIETDCIGNKPLKVEIETRDGFVGLRSIYPFFALINCLPYLALKSLEINYNSNLFNIIIDPQDGEVSFQYLYEINKEEDFNIEQFFMYFDELLKISRKEYFTLQRLCSGKVPNELSKYYRSLLEWTVYEAYGLQSNDENKYTKKRYEEIAKNIASMAPFNDKTNLEEIEFNIMRDFLSNGTIKGF